MLTTSRIRIQGSAVAATMNPTLIYDVGMHNGDDTAFYLAKGHRVIAIEADPALVKQAETRFSAERRSGQLTILKVGIAARSGYGEFWICEKNSIWNSFDRNIAARDGCAHHAVKVETRTFAEIVAEFQDAIARPARPSEDRTNSRSIRMSMNPSPRNAI